MNIAFSMPGTEMIQCGFVVMDQGSCEFLKDFKIPKRLQVFLFRTATEHAGFRTEVPDVGLLSIRFDRGCIGRDNIGIQKLLFNCGSHGSTGLSKFFAESIYTPGRKVELVTGKGVNKCADTVIRDHSFTIQKGSNRFDRPSVRNLGLKFTRNLKFSITVRIDTNFSRNRGDLQSQTVSGDICPAWGTQRLHTVPVTLFPDVMFHLYL